MPILSAMASLCGWSLMVVGFIWFWPLGLLVFGYLLISGRLGLWAAPKPWVIGALFSSGNAAFDEHRTEVLASLRQEQEAFAEFIRDVAKAKDRAQFDAFMEARSKRTKRGKVS